MSHLSLQLDNGITNYEPGAQVIATADWNLDEPVSSIELRLRWFTLGKGDSDSDVVQQLTFDNPGAVGQKRFGIQLPDSPYSFSGKLVSLQWVLELEALPSGKTDQVEITLAPDGREIVLGSEGSDEAAEPDSVDRSDSLL